MLQITINPELISAKGASYIYVYKSYTVTNGKRSMRVMIMMSEQGYKINCLIDSPVTKTWRSMGKDFDSFPEALNHYKNAIIKSFIEAAKERFLEEACSEWMIDPSDWKSNIIGRTLLDFDLVTDNPMFDPEQNSNNKYYFAGDEDGLTEELSEILIQANYF